MLYETSRTSDHLEMRQKQLRLMFCFFGVWCSPESTSLSFSERHRRKMATSCIGYRCQWRFGRQGSCSTLDDGI